MFKGKVKWGLPYQGKLRRGKVTKFWLGDENLHQRNFSPTNIVTQSNFPRESDDISLFYPQMVYSMH